MGFEFLVYGNIDVWLLPGVGHGQKSSCVVVLCQYASENIGAVSKRTSGQPILREPVVSADLLK
jgi:hypothetical protein